MKEDRSDWKFSDWLERGPKDISVWPKEMQDFLEIRTLAIAQASGHYIPVADKALPPFIVHPSAGQ